jgi:hypothetical protein
VEEIQICLLSFNRLASSPFASLILARPATQTSGEFANPVHPLARNVQETPASVHNVMALETPQSRLKASVTKAVLQEPPSLQTPRPVSHVLQVVTGATLQKAPYV